MSPTYDHDGDPVDPADVLDHEELADYQHSQRTKSRRRYARGPRHTGDPDEGTAQAEVAYEAWLDQMGGSA